LKNYTNFINKLLQEKKVWVLISIAIFGLYLIPLFLPHLYVQSYDNLDSNVLWYKLLAESGHIFAPNNTIIPNMMHGLPRASYVSEFDVLLWLYYFFSPKVAYIINELLIHIVAFIGSLLFLSKYIIKHGKNHYFLTFIGSLYFATLPFWSGTGITVASLPLTTYVLLDIKHHKSKVWHWLYLIVLPLYSSFVLMYIFYIGFLLLYLAYDKLYNRRLNKHLFYATVLLLTAFVLKEYRLFFTMFFDPGFVSHRVEFDVFFDNPLYPAYRYFTLQNFLIGHYPHLHTLQQIYLIPLSLVALFLLLKKEPLTPRESILFLGSILLTFTVNLLFFYNIWTPLVTSNYFLPGLLLLIVLTIKLNKKEAKLPLLLLWIILLALIVGLDHYQGLHSFAECFPILKAFNLTRASFITPILWMVVFVLSLKIILEKVHFGYLFIFLIFLFQMDLAFNENFYATYPKKGYVTFEEYYDPPLFKKIKHDIESSEDTNISNLRIVNYGIEPAPALYNGFYTIDGYSTNYPLSYKKKFRKTQAKQLLDINLSIIKGNRKLFDKWGSKLYLLGINSEPEMYRHYITTKTKPPLVHFMADYDALCDLNTSYVLSVYPLKQIDTSRLTLQKKYKGHFWSIWLYKLHCNKKSPIQTISAISKE